MHIFDLYEYLQTRPNTRITGVAEDDPAGIEMMGKHKVPATHKSVDALFDDADSFDVVAIGDYYGRRGSLAIRALELNKHVIVDKPLCTSLEELEKIESLRKSSKLEVGCMLRNRDRGEYRAAKRLIAAGAIGPVRTMGYHAQHPLSYGSRPGWYFEPGKHGGTINDIAIHAIDAIPWMIGQNWAEVVAARVWNPRDNEIPGFELCAQLMMRTDGQIGVMGDVSYLSPDSQEYTIPQYWRYTIHGDSGIMEVGPLLPKLQLWKDGGDQMEEVEPDDDREGGVFEDFLTAVEGSSRERELTTDMVIGSSRIALIAQRAAVDGTCPVTLTAQ